MCVLKPCEDASKDDATPNESGAGTAPLVTRWSKVCDAYPAVFESPALPPQRDIVHTI